MPVRFSEILKNKLIYGLCTVLYVSKAPELLTQLQTIRLQCSLVLDRNNDNNYVHDDDDEFTFVQDERGLHKLEFVHTATTGGSNIELSGEFFLFLNKRKRERERESM